MPQKAQNTWEDLREALQGFTEQISGSLYVRIKAKGIADRLFFFSEARRGETILELWLRSQSMDIFDDF